MQGEFTGAAFSATHEMVVTRSELFRFELTAGSVPVEFVIRNEQGQILHRFSLDQNHTQALDVLLQPGKYTLETRLKNGPSVVAGKTFRLRMADLSNPIGPVLLEPEEPTTQPKTSSTTNPESSTSSISKTTTKKADSRVAPEPVEYSYYEDPGYYWYTEPTTTIVDPNSSYESYDANLYPYTWYW
jgi:hypothetical protein